MARLFQYGKLNRTVTKAGRNGLPGTFFSAYGVQYGAGAFNVEPDKPLEFGEAVEIVSQNERAYGVKRVTTTVTADTLAFVVRDIVGIRTIKPGVAEEPGKDVPLTVIPANSPNGWEIIVPISDTLTPTIGGKVYINTGAGSTVAGAVNTASTNAIDSGWVFASEKFAPTTGAGRAVVIRKI